MLIFIYIKLLLKYSIFRVFFTIFIALNVIQMFYVFLFQFSNLAFAVGGNLRGEDNEDKTDNQVKTKQNKTK
jgi:hypothetical protein